MKDIYRISRVILCILTLFLIHSCKKDEDNISVTDIDNNVYETVDIGTQVWMIENLKVTKYQNGDPIPNVTDAIQWGISTIGDAYCY